MNKNPPHVSVCICTFRRPNLLMNLLEKIKEQYTGGFFTFSIVVADNDRNQSAKSIVSSFSSKSNISITYCVEPEQNIALARNKAIQHAMGEFIAFIDDDEEPEKDWLFNLVKTCQVLGADGVLGPVRPKFVEPAPRWILKSKFFQRPEYETGYKLHWSETRTGNVLFKKNILDGIKYPFRPEFGTGSEDVDFFRRMIAKRNIFVWCNEAVVYELISARRCTLPYQLKLALLRGANSFKHRGIRLRNILKSLVAVPAYCLVLPILFFLIRYRFTSYLVSLFDHLGRLAALLGLNPVKKREL